ncbi:MAG: hypothetical protein WC612_08020 [Bdellovibrionales bacterium]
MSDLENIKPSYDEWMYWAQVIIDRLTTVAHVYAKPPHSEIFFVEKERQSRLASTTDIMRRLHDLTDEHDFSIPKDEPEERDYEEKLIAMITPLFYEVMTRLPEWSEDMQKLLNSPWARDCAGRLALILFCGPDGRHAEGIGSGMVENGRLPASLAALLDREEAGGERAPRIEKPRFAEKHMRREELANLWSKKNSTFLRSAGRMN